MTIEEKRRELFEACARDEGAPLDRDITGSYIFECTASAWSIINAALDAVVIDLELAVRSTPCGPIGGTMWTKEVYAAIESTGLGLKVKS